MGRHACIYAFTTDNHATNGSHAHIIPSAIGGRKASTTIACADHNNLTNSRIEKPFIETVAFLNTMLAIVPGRGGTVPLIRGLLAADGKRYNIRPGGFPEEGKAQKREWIDGATRRIELSGYSKRELMRIADGLKNKYPDLTIEGTRREAATGSVEVQHRLRFGPETTRLAAKIGFEFLAERIADRAHILAPSFDGARRFVLDGMESGECFAFYDSRAIRPNVALGPLDHGVVVMCDATTGLACAFVTFYGHLSLTVLLSRQWEGPTVGYEYAVDPLTGAQHEAEAMSPRRLSIDEIYERKAEDASTPERRWSMGRTMGNAVMETSMRRRPMLSRRDIVKKAFEEEVQSGNGSSFTKEDLRRAALYIADAIMSRQDRW